MNEQYVSYNTAKLLKEKGFDWECFGYYVDSKPKEVMFSMCGELNSTWESRCCAAPTQQMACKWLREEKKIFIGVFIDNYYYQTFIDEIPAIDQATYNIGESYETYEEALEEGIKYVLKNLI